MEKKRRNRGRRRRQDLPQDRREKGKGFENVKGDEGGDSGTEGEDEEVYEGNPGKIGEGRGNQLLSKRFGKRG